MLFPEAIAIYGKKSIGKIKSGEFDKILEGENVLYIKEKRD